MASVLENKKTEKFFIYTTSFSDTNTLNLKITVRKNVDNNDSFLNFQSFFFTMLRDIKCLVETNPETKINCIVDLSSEAHCKNISIAKKLIQFVFSHTKQLHQRIIMCYCVFPKNQKNTAMCIQTIFKLFKIEKVKCSVLKD